MLYTLNSLYISRNYSLLRNCILVPHIEVKFRDTISRRCDEFSTIQYNDASIFSLEIASVKYVCLVNVKLIHTLTEVV